MTKIYLSQDGDDSQLGDVPDYPRKSIPDDGHYPEVYLKRGDDFHDSLRVMNGTIYSSYGNNDAPKPRLINEKGTHFKLEKRRSITFKDIHLLGGDLGIYMFNCKNIEIDGLHFSDTLGVGRHSVYSKVGENITLKNSSNQNTQGDVFYATQTKGVKIIDNKGELPNGGKADWMQTTHEGQEGRYCSDLIVSGNKIKHGLFTNNYKGAMAIEGTRDYEVFDNEIEGRSFGIQCSGENGRIYGNTVFRLSHRNGRGFGIGVGAQNSGENIDIFDNTICFSDRGIVVSYANGPHARNNINIWNNNFFKCGQDVFIDVPMTGRVDGIKI